MIVKAVPGKVSSYISHSTASPRAQAIKDGWTQVFGGIRPLDTFNVWFHLRDGFVIAVFDTPKAICIGIAVDQDYPHSLRKAFVNALEDWNHSGRLA